MATANSFPFTEEAYNTESCCFAIVSVLLTAVSSGANYFRSCSRFTQQGSNDLQLHFIFGMACTQLHRKRKRLLGDPHKEKRLCPAHEEERNGGELEQASPLPFSENNSFTQSSDPEMMLHSLTAVADLLMCSRG